MTVLPRTPGEAPCLRNRVLATRFETRLWVADGGRGLALNVGWPIDRHELSVDGAYLFALGDRGQRGAVWQVSTGRCVLEILGASVRTQSLRASLATIGDSPYCLASTRQGALVAHALTDGGRPGWQNLSGWVAFYVERAVPLGGDWLAIHGSRHAEQYYTAAIVPTRELLDDTEVLQTALRERPAMVSWGYEIAVGPAGPEQAVMLKDPSWDDDDRPDDPDEATRGFLFWDLASGRVVERLPYAGEIPNAGTIAATARHAAIARADSLELIERGSGASSTIEALAFDPYRFEVARATSRGTVVEPVVVTPR